MVNRVITRRLRRAAQSLGYSLLTLSHPAHGRLPARRSRRAETAEERHIRRYVEIESSDDPSDAVETVELVKRHRVLGQPYEVFDVRCERSRWWVITNMTKLYDQAEFRTADYAFSFHLGLMLRMMHEDRVTTDEEYSSVSDRAWRKYQDAVEALGEANDTEDYQAIGVRLREAMIALVADQAAEEWVKDVQSPPQLANVKGWLEVFAKKMTPKRRQRAYVRSVWEKAWDLVVHLQHDSSAVDWDAEIAVNSVSHALETFMHMKVRNDRADQNPCPKCGSHRFQETTDWGPDGELMSWEECSACGFATQSRRTGVNQGLSG